MESYELNMRNIVLLEKVNAALDHAGHNQEVKKKLKQVKENILSNISYIADSELPSHRISAESNCQS